ncbi:nitroreductase family protein [Actinokineospora sp. NPDC004072]
MTPFDVLETDRLLTTTRSVRRRLDLERPVPRAVIEEALEVAVQAPTANDQQNWRWVVVTEAATKAQIAELVEIAWNFHEKESWTRSGRRREQAKRNRASAAALVSILARVPVMVIPCVLGRPPDIGEIDRQWLQTRMGKQTAGVTLGAMRASNFYGSIFPAIWSFQLALRSRGLGSTITCTHVPFERQVGDLLGIPAGVTQICLIPVAYTIGTEFRPANRHAAKERTHWERWQP